MEHKENTGTIFKNDFKKNDNHPDYKGTANVNGELKEVALWVRTGKNSGKKFFSLVISEPYKKDENKEAGQETSQENSGDDDLPF